MLQVGKERLGREVHAAWRDKMLAQGREVAPARLDWDTLEQEDRELDRYIGERLARLIVEAMMETSHA